MKRIRSLLLLPTLLLALPLLAGCEYEEVDILVGREMYFGRILSDWRDVETTPTGILLKPGSRFAIRTLKETQASGQLEVAILEGRGVTIYMRTVPHRFDTTQGIAFRYAIDGCLIRNAEGKIIPLEYNAETEQQILTLFNEARRMRLSVGCDQLYEGDVSLPGTEYTILEPLPGSTVEIRSVNYFETDRE